MASHAAKGKQLLAASKYAEAIEQFNLALATSPTSPDYLIQRSTAYQRSKQFDHALGDAEAAVVYAQQRAKRELIIQAQLRRGIALFGLERYGDARFALEIVKRMDNKEKSVDLWLNKSNAKLASLSEDDEAAKVTVKETPELAKPHTEENADALPRTAAPVNTQPSQTPAEKIRHEWYQNNDTIFFSLLAKGVPKERAVIEINASSLSISYPIESNGSTFEYNLDPLFADVLPDASSFKILSTKIEISLKKRVSGQKWSSLEGSERAVEKDTTESENEKPQVTQAVGCSAPAYPTSSKSGPKNWDKIVDDNATTGEIDDELGGDDASKFFKHLYKGASAETQRAMMKSYVESNGTALSTDWSEVSKGKVETVPPDGMESKKWSS